MSTVTPGISPRSGPSPDQLANADPAAPAALPVFEHDEDISLHIEQLISLIQQFGGRNWTTVVIRSLRRIQGAKTDAKIIGALHDEFWHTIGAVTDQAGAVQVWMDWLSSRPAGATWAHDLTEELSRGHDLTPSAVGSILYAAARFEKCDPVHLVKRVKASHGAAARLPEPEQQQ